MKKMKAIPSDLSSEGTPESDQDSDLESELELELIGKKNLRLGLELFSLTTLARLDQEY